MKFFFPIHLDAGNRGCEGIAKGSALILKESANSLIGYSRSCELDRSMGIDKFVTLVSYHKLSLIEKIIRKIKFNHSKSAIQKLYISCSYLYDSFLKKMTNEDLLVSTGGDMMCYPNNQVIYTTDYAFKRNIKSVLWGCSMGENDLTPEKHEILKKFSLIYARESFSYDFFKGLGLGKVICFPDPAFIIQPEKVELPSEFKNSKVIGVNLSNFVIPHNNLFDGFGVEIKRMIDYILENTNYKILLIPHVLWDDQDDRVISNKIYNLYGSERISILNSLKYNYCQLRFIIGNCHLFIGARTHSVISAYSTFVPTIAIGYSIKARGIAKDIGLPEQLVIDSKKDTFRGELLKSFIYLNKHSECFRQHLLSFIPIYTERLNKLKEVLLQQLMFD